MLQQREALLREKLLIKKFCKEEVLVMLERIDDPGASNSSLRRFLPAENLAEPPFKKQKLAPNCLNFSSNKWNHGKYNMFNIPFYKLELQENDFAWSGDIPFGHEKSKQVIPSEQCTQYSLISSEEESSNQSSDEAVDKLEENCHIKSVNDRTKGKVRFSSIRESAANGPSHNFSNKENSLRSKDAASTSKGAAEVVSKFVKNSEKVAKNGVGVVSNAKAAENLDNFPRKEGQIERKRKEVRLYSLPRKQQNHQNSTDKPNLLPADVCQRLRKELEERNLASKNRVRKEPVAENSKRKAGPEEDSSKTAPNFPVLPAPTRRKDIINRHYSKSPVRKGKAVPLTKSNGSGSDIFKRLTLDGPTVFSSNGPSKNAKSDDFLAHHDLKKRAVASKIWNSGEPESTQGRKKKFSDGRFFKKRSSKDLGGKPNIKDTVDEFSAVFSPEPLPEPGRSILKIGPRHGVKKTLIFREDKNQIHEIPKRSKKQAGREEANFFDSSLQQKCLCLSLIEQVVFCILRWNPIWFKEYRGDVNFLPPIFDETVQFKKRRVRTTFDDYNEYVDVMKPLLICEIWENAFYFHKTYTVNQKSIACVVWPAKDTTAVEVFQDYNVRAAVLRTCDEFQMDSLVEFSFGDLSLNQNCFLGIIISFSSQPVRSLNDVCANLREYVPSDKASEYKVISFSIRAKAKSNIPRNYHGVLNVKGVCTIVRYLRIAETLMYLKSFKLSKAILSAEATHFSFESGTEFDEEIQDKISVCAEDLFKRDGKIFSLSLNAQLNHANYIVDIIEMIQKMKVERSKESGSVKETVLVCCSNYYALDSISRALINRIRAYRVSDPDKKFVNFVRVGDQMAEDIQPYSLDSIAARNLKMTCNEEDNAALQESTNLTAADLHIEISHIKGQLAHLETLPPSEAGDVSPLEAKLQELEKKMKKCKDKRISKSLMYRQKCNIIFHADVIAVSLQDCCSQPLCSTLQDERKALKVLCAIVDDAQASLELETLIPLGFGVDKLVLFGSSAEEARQLCIKSEVARSLGFGSFFHRLENKRLGIN